MIGWLLDLLFGWIGRKQAAADAARADARVEQVRRQAVEDRAESDRAVQGVDDAMARLRRDWRRPGAVVAMIIALGASACTPPPAEVRVVDTGCDWTRPIYVNDLDQFSPGTARAVLAHNETWRKRCGK